MKPTIAISIGDINGIGLQIALTSHNKIKKYCNPLYFVDQNIKLEPIYDFYLMTLCKHFIVSPSTFSWWAAWLSKNKNKICISPPGNMRMSLNRDVIPDDWINI